MLSNRVMPNTPASPSRRMRPAARRLSRHAAAAVTLSVFLAACGGGGNDAESSVTTDALALDDTSAQGDVAASREYASRAAVGAPCFYTHNAFNPSPSVNAFSQAAWRCNSGQRTLVANGIPDHDVGIFPNPANPNAISVQQIALSLPLRPAVVSAGAPARVPGFVLNGVKLDPATDGTCSVDASGAVSCAQILGTGPWNIEALGQSSFIFGTDLSNGHVQPGGAYHYHGMPEGFLKPFKAMRLVGFAVDGFPIFARWGFKNPQRADSGVKIIGSSYRLKPAPDPGRPPVSMLPMGSFTQDYAYVAGSGDLDECNGRTGAAPGYPEGTYHYFITDSYPFVQRCVKGAAVNLPPPPPPPPPPPSPV